MIHKNCVELKEMVKFCSMTAKISENEFKKICENLRAESDLIYKHNPIGTKEETMLWMLLIILLSYLSLSEIETPCFTGMPTAETYHNAILFILKDKREDNFNVENYLNELTENL